MDGSAFGLIGGTGVHLVQALRRCAYLESAERTGGALAPGDQLRHTHDGVGTVFLAEVRHQRDGIAVEDHRRVTGLAEVERHHVRIDRGQRVQAEVLGDLACRRKLHRPRDLVTESVDQFDGRRHAAAVRVGLQAHRFQPRALQDRRGGQSVVAGADDDGVVVRHCPISFPSCLRICQY